MSVHDARRPSTGVLTFLFTDIEGSTRRWEADAEAMRTALQAHNLTLRDAIEAQGGDLFNYTGDGVCAVFHSPLRAIGAAIAAQRALDLPVRMGIATGEAEQRGDDYFGTVLNRTARVMAAGHGGQILVDGATASLTASGVELTALGPKRLRDIAKPVEIFQVGAPGLHTDFPPLRTLDPTPGNIRPPATRLIGREPELADLETVLKEHRLVTLTGVGGVGKTRLALELAIRVMHVFPDGVWLIELATINDPIAVPEVVAATMGVNRQPSVSLTESLAAALEGRLRLLVFDNCEHVLDAAASTVEAIFEGCPTVKILATSRQGLGVADEQLWPIRALEVRPSAESSATTLFVERSRAVAPNLALSGSDSDVVEICRRLDGLPLAIELAASRLQSMTVAELRDRLDHRFRLLVGSRRGAGHHQTLRHAVQWSYDLLDEAEKHVLTTCSVFAGGFDLAGACAVTGCDDDFAALDLLDALVRKSLLGAGHSSGQTRFSMLETIRQFAEEQLASAGAAAAARTAHARYFAERAQAVLAMWNGQRQREAYSWLTEELANLRVAFRWSADRHDLDTASAIAVYATFLGFWIEQHEPIRWAEKLIGPARAVQHRRLAQLYLMAGRYVADEALGYTESGRLAMDTGGYDPVPYDLEAWLGGAYLSRGKPDGYVEWCRKLMTQQSGPQPFTQSCLVIALTMAGLHDEAVANADGLLTSADAVDNPAIQAMARLAWSMANRDADPVTANEVGRRGLEIAQSSGNQLLESQLALTLSRLAALHGDPADAFDYVTVAIRNRYDSGNFSLMRSPLGVLASLLDRLGHAQPAAVISKSAATPLTQTAYPEITTAIRHLRATLGEQAYESLAQSGERMTDAAMAAYAFEQIEQARALLPRP
ncbi:ATP-binding protein [Mycobacterium sp. NPDC048908]|uniref:ATP-binding protein n=1 Tax=Mycobacterium sp. NPDC048908 TaxID=3364292 RepID=UPI00372399EA